MTPTATAADTPAEPQLPASLRTYTDFLTHLNQSIADAGFVGALPLTEGPEFRWSNLVNRGSDRGVGEAAWLHIDYREFNFPPNTTPVVVEMGCYVNEDDLIISADLSSRDDLRQYGVFLLMAISTSMTQEQAQAVVNGVITEHVDLSSRDAIFANVGEFTFYYAPYFEQVGVFVTDADQSTRTKQYPA